MKTTLPDSSILRGGAMLFLLIGLLMSGSAGLQAQVPNPCDSISITPEYFGPGCCWDFVLSNNTNLQKFNSITATILTQDATVLRATGGSPTTTTAITASWGFPNDLPRGTTRVAGCFTSQSGVITLFFEWKYNGITVCTDTLTLDCPTGTGEDCHTDTVRLNTGWNPFSRRLDAAGEYTTTWQIVDDPEFGTTEPRPAVILPTDTLWSGPLGSSRWIGSYPDSNDHRIGTYTFESCFCIRGDVPAIRLTMKILADDRARVSVNGNFVGGTPTSQGYRAPATQIDTDITRYLRTGRNCIRVEVDNTVGTKMGLNIEGHLSATRLGLLKQECCYRGGAITGTKFHDLDCDGVRDPDEPGLAGFTIISSHGDTTMTDAHGNYYFLDVPQGTWDVREVNLPGWRQSYPDSLSPTHGVPVVNGKAIDAFDFGNCNDEVDTTGCLGYRGDTTWCEKIDDRNIFTHQFSIRSLLPCKVNQSASVTVVGPPGLTVSPNRFLVSENLYQQSIRISGPGAVPGATVALEVEICCIEGGGRGQAGDTIECCYQIIRLELPKCSEDEEEDPKECGECCNEFPKLFPRLSQWSSSSGITSITGEVAAGTERICRVSATLTEVRVNGLPAYGQFVPTGLLDGQPGAQPSMHELEWTNIDLSSGPRPFNLRVQTPGLAWNAIYDELEYCVRFRFTDVTCVTCDTVICFTQRRTRWIFPGGLTPTGEIAPEKGDRIGPASISAGVTSAGITGELTGAEAGRLEVTFPEPPAGLGAITYVGLEVAPSVEFVEITGATSAEATFRRSGPGVASLPFAYRPADQMSVDLTYNGLNDRSSLEHRVTIRFVRNGFELDTLEEIGRLTLSRESFRGGDSLELGEKVEDVRTWTLWLHNRNGADEPLRHLRLSTPEGIEILAVGPGPETQSTVIAFAEGEGAGPDVASIDLTGVATSVEADGTIGPIYLTLGGSLERFDIRFTTINGTGTVVSEGSITVEDDPSSVSDGTKERVRGGRLLDRLYPNPTTGSTTLGFRTPGSGEETAISLIDASGREVMILLDRKDLHAGDHRLTFESDHLASGAYHVVLRYGDIVERLPLEIVR